MDRIDKKQLGKKEFKCFKLSKKKMEIVMFPNANVDLEDMLRNMEMT